MKTASHVALHRQAINFLCIKVLQGIACNTPLQSVINNGQRLHVTCSSQSEFENIADVHVCITGSGGASAPASSQAAPPKQASTGINESQPATTLQIRLADGSKLTGRFNLTQTVQDVKK